MMTWAYVTFMVLLVIDLGAIISVCVFHSKTIACYEKQIKMLKKQVDKRDRLIELQDFVIDTQSELIARKEES